MIQLFEVCDSGPHALEIPASVERFDDLYQHLELGVYTALRTFEGYKFLALDHHLQRTADSIAGLKWDYAFHPELIRKQRSHTASNITTPGSWHINPSDQSEQRTLP